jgi:large subunit ribosomal protein L1
MNLFVNVPHKIKDKRVAAFFEVQHKTIDTITPDQFKKYSEKGELKKLVNNYDFFIAQASVMPKVATTFGRALGPAGKMPSPQQGILINADDKLVHDLLMKVNTSIKIKPKEASIKMPIAKQDMKDSEIIENVMTVYNALLKELPKGKDNVKNIELKFTMTKPYKIKVK